MIKDGPHDTDMKTWIIKTRKAEVTKAFLA
jgi:hypothetical protein